MNYFKQAILDTRGFIFGASLAIPLCVAFSSHPWTTLFIVGGVDLLLYSGLVYLFYVINKSNG